MAKSWFRLILPNTVNGTVPPRRQKNSKLRTREYLTEAEVDRLIKAAKANRYGKRDATMILVAFRHGLRPSELVDLRWDQVDLGRNAGLHVRRVKSGIATTHPLQGDEMRALRELKRNRVALRVCLGAWRAVHHSGLCEDGGPIGPGGRVQVPSSSAHAASCVRLRPGQQRPRHSGAAGLSRPQEHSAHGSLYRIIPDTLQGLLERLA